MTEQDASLVQQIETAISSLESQRAILGDTTVDLTLTPLRQKLAKLRVACCEIG